MQVDIKNECADRRSEGLMASRSRRGPAMKNEVGNVQIKNLRAARDFMPTIKDVADKAHMPKPVAGVSTFASASRWGRRSVFVVCLRPCARPRPSFLHIDQTSFDWIILDISNDVVEFCGRTDRMRQSASVIDHSSAGRPQEPMVCPTPSITSRNSTHRLKPVLPGCRGLNADH